MRCHVTRATLSSLALPRFLSVPVRLEIVTDSLVCSQAVVASAQRLGLPSERGTRFSAKQPSHSLRVHMATALKKRLSNLCVDCHGFHMAFTHVLSPCRYRYVNRDHSATTCWCLSSARLKEGPHQLASHRKILTPTIVESASH